MKGKIILAGNVLALAGVATCTSSTSYPVDPFPTFGIDVTVVADGLTYTATAGGPAIPAAARQVHLVAQVSGPPGDWPFSMGTDGALSIGGVIGGGGLDGGAATTTVHIASADQPVIVQIPAAPQPVGDAVVQASFGTLTQSFRFVVAPVVPKLALCEPDLGGGCVPPMGQVAAMGPTYVDDAGVEWVPYPPSDGGVWRDGDRASLVITSDVLPGQDGVAWAGTVSTDGALWLINGGQITRTQSIQFTQDGGPAVASVSIVGAGPSGAFASIGNGPPATLIVQSESASVVPHRVELVGYTGLQARNRVTLCSSRLSGSLGVSLDGGAVFPPSVPLSVTPGSACVDPYPGQADFVWTGYDALAIWTVTDQVVDGGAPRLVAVPTLGTGVSAQFAQPPTVTWLIDAGPNTGDGGTTGLAQVTGTLQRISTTKGGPAPMPLDGTSVSVTAPAGVTPSPSSFTTDAAGYFAFTVTKASSLAGIPVTIFLAVDQRITLPLVVP